MHLELSSQEEEEDEEEKNKADEVAAKVPFVDTIKLPHELVQLCTVIASLCRCGRFRSRLFM